MKKGLIIGINDYPDAPLTGCITDAASINAVLVTNSDGSPNFDTKLITSDIATLTRANLRKEVVNLFQGDADIALLYFAGHGSINQFGGHIVSTDTRQYDEGVSMDDILKLANESQAKNRIVILDCCFSGNMGSPAVSGGVHAALASGVTILTACREKEAAQEKDGRGIFTSLLVEAIHGGSSDLQGNVSPGGVYAYVDRALGPWEQRPVFKTNVSKFISLRTVTAPINTEVLRNVTEYFGNETDEFFLDPTFEYTEGCHKVENVKIFKELQKMESVGMLVPVGEEHMYWAAMNSKSCKLTAMGSHYWRLVKTKRI